MKFFQVFFLFHLQEHLDVFALSVLLLGFTLAISLSTKRQPSIAAELLIFVLIAGHLAQIVFAAIYPWEYFGWLRRFAFLPISIEDASAHLRPGGSWLQYLWTPFTYTLLHNDAIHLFFNGVALFIFGRAVAWRLGVGGFLTLFFLSAAVGAVAHNVGYWGVSAPLVGASAGVFGMMGATFRFVPGASDRLKALFWPELEIRQLPIVGVSEMLMTRRYLAYILVCFLIFPVGLTAFLAGTSGNISVMAHLGGFAVGVFGAGYLDWHDPDFRLAPQAVDSMGKKSEPKGIRFLRGLSVAMMVIGIIIGILGYYLPSAFT